MNTLERRLFLAISSLGILSAAAAAAQDAAPAQAPAVPAQAPASAPATQETGAFERSAQDLEKRLEESLAELAALRAKIADEKVPLMRRLTELEQGIVEARKSLQQTNRLLDVRTLDLTKVAAEIKARREEVAYLSNLLTDYLRSFESGLHVAELQRFRKELADVRLAAENDELSAKDAFEIQARMLGRSLGRLEEALGGVRFEGSAVDAAGTVNQGTFLLAGPAAIFRSSDGAKVGTAEQRLGSLEPALVAFESPELVRATGEYVASGAGALPFDPTLGTAHRIAQTEETILEHVQKGGPVMVPIFALAGAALLVSLYQWIAMLFVRMPSERAVRGVLQAVAAGDAVAAKRLAGALPGPLGRMLESGAENLHASREVVEEVMFESMQRTQRRMQSLLPFVAISASAAPLLGLLGTVTGIMNTFKMITIYGTGDVKALSSGISEALITTEYGLIVAIPSLLLHAYLASKARKIGNRLESAGIAFTNEMAKRETRVLAKAG